MRPGEAAVVAARAAIGVRFRLHGRGEDGLDCIGLAALAMRAEGYRGAVPRGYALRGGDSVRAAEMLAAGGLVAGEPARTGDLLLVRSGPGQLHFAISTGTGVVHADAMLRRVVERPDLPWPVLGRWRMPAGD